MYSSIVLFILAIWPCDFVMINAYFTVYKECSLVLEIFEYIVFLLQYIGRRFPVALYFCVMTTICTLYTWDLSCEQSI